MKKLYFLFSLLMATVIGLSSCESDDSLTNEPPAQEYIDKAKEILVGDLVLSTRATMSGVDKTLLESGCPTKFNFSWREDGTMVLDLSDFTVGAMPFAITFRCATKFMQLNSWEKDEYPGSGWVKFVGTDGPCRWFPERGHQASGVHRGLQHDERAHRNLPARNRQEPYRPL